MFLIIATFFVKSFLFYESLLSEDGLEKVINSVTFRTAKEMEVICPKLLVGGIGGSMKDDVILFESISFNYYDELKVDIGASIIIDIVNKYLSNVYKEKRLKGYLENHPFTYENLDISLIAENKECTMIYHPDLAFINLQNGMILYKSIELNEKGCYIVKILQKEPYENAVKRLSNRKDG